MQRVPNTPAEQPPQWTFPFQSTHSFVKAYRSYTCTACVHNLPGCGFGLIFKCAPDLQCSQALCDRAHSTLRKHTHTSSSDGDRYGERESARKKSKSTSAFETGPGPFFAKRDHEPRLASLTPSRCICASIAWHYIHTHRLHCRALAQAE